MKIPPWISSRSERELLAVAYLAREAVDDVLSGRMPVHSLGTLNDRLNKAISLYSLTDEAIAWKLLYGQPIDNGLHAEIVEFAKENGWIHAEIVVEYLYQIRCDEGFDDKIREVLREGVKSLKGKTWLTQSPRWKDWKPIVES